MESLPMPSRNYYDYLSEPPCRLLLTMKLSKRTPREFSPTVDEDFRPTKRVSEKASRTRMDIEYDIDEDHQMVPYQGASNFGLTFFDEEGCTNNFASDPLFRDTTLVKSYERTAFLRFLSEMMAFHQVPPAEIRRRISDPDFLRKSYEYLKLLCSQKCLTQD